MIGLIPVLGVSGLGVVYAAYNFWKVKRLNEGTEEMADIANSIRIGALAFLYSEYKVLIKVVAVLTVLFGAFLSISSAISFLLGIVFSGAAGYVGMRMSTYANVRVTNTALKTNSIGKTLKVALRGGSVMGLCVSSFALLGLIIVFALFKDQIRILSAEKNWCGISFVPFGMTLSSYSLGCSVIALFNRVGGGIYTKAADMGADLVGKGEEGIGEDDYRNAAAIADSTGDNVGDTAGLGSDLLESYMGAIVSGIILAMHLFITYKAKGMPFSESLFEKMYLFPILVCGAGLLSCIIGLAYAFLKADGDNPHRELNVATWLSAGLTGVSAVVLSIVLFSGENFGELPFRLGVFSPCVAIIIGVVSGVAIGRAAEYYTSYDYRPTKKLAESAEEGAAVTIVQGLAVGMKSNLMPVVILGAGMLLSYAVLEFYGVAMAAVGMLSFVSATVSVDTYGPISDNAGGIAEMAHLNSFVRAITDRLDAEGNTTAAMGKGFAIGSAAYATVSLMISFMYTFTPVTEDIVFNLMNPLCLVGALVGGAITFYFSGLLMEAVSKAAQKMVDEVRRQFREIVGLREGVKGVKPDYKRCIEISSQGALSEMKLPVLIAILVPTISGFIMGPLFVAGILIGETLVAIFLAIFCGNAGGAWDNSKKAIEAKGLKGLPIHFAAIVGDTVGDPLKDTVGPSLDILIKIMATVSLIMVSIYSQYNLLDLISSLL